MALHRRLAGVVLVTVLGCTACSGDDSGKGDEHSPSRAPTSAESTATEVATPDPDDIVGRGVPSADVTAAADSVGKALAELNGALASPEDAADSLDETLVAGAAREALLAQAAEYADNGWTVSGQPRIVRMVVRAQGTNLRVRACVDQSRVKVADEAGNELTSGAASARTAMIFVLAPVKTGWRVIDQTFPDDPDC